MFSLTQKWKKVKGILKNLNKEGFFYLHANEIRTTQAHKECQVQLHQQPSNVELRRKETVAAQAHKIAHESYRSFLKQKEKCAWLKDGDSNT